MQKTDVDCAAGPRPGMRIDKLLWYLRLAPTRGAAQRLIAAGHVRHNGTRVENPHRCVREGDVVTLPAGSGARAVRLTAMPRRRGPAGEARWCYEAIGETPPPAAVLTRESLAHSRIAERDAGRRAPATGSAP